MSESSLAPKSVSLSATERVEHVLPPDTNHHGTVFGGRVMQWMDLCAGVAAQRHCRRVCVTASVDDLHFLAPIRMGEFAIVKAHVNATFRTSIEVGVRVEGEDPFTGVRRKCLKAYLTFVAIDERGKPVAVPSAIAESDDEKRRMREAHARRAERLARKPR